MRNAAIVTGILAIATGRFVALREATGAFMTDTQGRPLFFEFKVAAR